MGRPSNISEIVEDELCTGCGTCAAFCPTGAIIMTVSDGIFLPLVDANRCTECSLCVQVCPGSSVDFQALNASIFGKTPDDSPLGNLRQCFLAQSANAEIQYNSASGGLVTQLLVSALEKGLIDGALVVRMDTNNPLKPESFIARTREEIVDSSKSKYCPVPINEALRNVAMEEGRFAVVGLPCHIHGIRKAEEVVKGLRDRLVLRIGLFCSHTVSFCGTLFLLRKLGLRPDQVTRIDYRGMGWPGFMLIQLKSGSSLRIPYVGGWNSYWPVFSSFFFTPLRCLMCPDEANELADVSCGDAWLPELKGERAGKSVVIVRSQKGEMILNQASSAGVVRLEVLGSRRVKHSQDEPLRFKKDDFDVRLAMLQHLGKKTPLFNRRIGSQKSVFSWLRNFFVLLNVRISENPRLQRYLAFVPLPLFRLYYGAYKGLSIF